MAKWSRDELILTLDLYLRSNRRILEPHNPDLVAVLEVINRLRMQADTTEGRLPRTGGSIKAKMANFRGLDPDHPGKGWGNIGQPDLAVWNDYANDPTALSQEVVRIHRRAKTGQP